jgi:hypothetical protein
MESLAGATGVMGAAVAAPDMKMAEAATIAKARLLMNPPDLPDERAPASNRGTEFMTDTERVPFVFRANWFQFRFSRFGMIQLANRE